MYYLLLLVISLVSVFGVSFSAIGFFVGGSGMPLIFILEAFFGSLIIVSIYHYFFPEQSSFWKLFVKTILLILLLQGLIIGSIITFTTVKERITNPAIPKEISLIFVNQESVINNRDSAKSEIRIKGNLVSWNEHLWEEPRNIWNYFMMELDLNTGKGYVTQFKENEFPLTQLYHNVLLPEGASVLDQKGDYLLYTIEEKTNAGIQRNIKLINIPQRKEYTLTTLGAYELKVTENGKICYLFEENRKYDLRIFDFSPSQFKTVLSIPREQGFNNRLLDCSDSYLLYSYNPDTPGQASNDVLVVYDLKENKVIFNQPTERFGPFRTKAKIIGDYIYYSKERNKINRENLKSKTNETIVVKDKNIPDWDIDGKYLIYEVEAGEFGSYASHLYLKILE